MAFSIYFHQFHMFQIRLCVYFYIWYKQNTISLISNHIEIRQHWTTAERSMIITTYHGHFESKNKCSWVQNVQKVTNWNIPVMNELNVFPFSLKIWWPMFPRTRPPMTSQNLLNLLHHSAPGFLLTRSWIYRPLMWRHQARKQCQSFTSDPISTPESLLLLGQPLTEEP